VRVSRSARPHRASRPVRCCVRSNAASAADEREDVGVDDVGVGRQQHDLVVVAL
jgi:hypothetical protein